MFLRPAQNGMLSEDDHREIRQMIVRPEEKGSKDSFETVKYHMILFLAREFEENRIEAEMLLNNLKLWKSPLEGALEDPPPPLFSKDTPLMKTGLRMEPSHMRQVLEAWFGLFGRSVPKDAHFMTLDLEILRYARELFEPEDEIIQPEKASGDKSCASDPPRSIIRLPLLSEEDKASTDPVKRGLSGRTIFLLED